MSWLYSQALVAEYSAGNSLGGEPCAPLKSIPTPQAFLHKDKMTGFSRPSRFGMTFAPLTANHGKALLMWFLEVSRARTSRSRGGARVLRAHARGSGESSQGSFARFDPDTSSWKTPQLSLLGGLEPYLETWPRWGSLRSGVCWERTRLELRTSGIGSGLLPTPLSTLGSNGGPNQRDSRGRHGLQMAAMTWPTPTSSCGGKEPPGKTGRKLATVVHWPTPTVSGNHNRKGSSKKAGDGLATSVLAAETLYPTPCAQDAKNSTLPASQTERSSIPGHLLRSGEKPGGQLNPTWVEWLMGWPLGWTDLKPLAMDKYRNRPLKRGVG